MNWYILDEDGRTPIPTDDLTAMGEWRVQHPPTEPPVAVGKADVGGLHVSTVFLVHDHRHWGEGPPILWETMIFHGGADGDGREQWRYSSYEAALAGHNHVVAELTRGVPAEEIDVD